MEITHVKWTDLPAGPTWLVPPSLDAVTTSALAVLRARVDPDPELVWVASSGTSGAHVIKCLGLTRGAILSSAAAVNAHLGATARDRWLVAIPTYHVGGFAIAARAHLSRSAVDVLPRWSAAEFHAVCAARGTTLCSLVPTQIYDLVTAALRAPGALRAIVVGGGALDPALRTAARALGWPVLPSYGLTETASQIATADVRATNADPFALRVLDHAEVRVDDGRIAVRAPSLARWRAVVGKDGVVTIDDPRDAEGWLVTEDLGTLRDGRLTVLGRVDDVVKILGVLVSVPQIEAELRASVREPARLIVLSVPDPRRGATLIAVTDQTTSIEDVVRAQDEHNARVPGPRRVERLAWVPEIPRTSLGKVQRASLRAVLGLDPA